MSRWPIEDVGLDRLSLDLCNVRIPGSSFDESAIASYLAEAEDLLELAGGILRDGYLDNELPVVTDEDGRLVVLEGNRRVAALKAFRYPALLGRSAAKIERLMSRYPDIVTPGEVRVMIAPSREAAQPMLARLHTRNPKKSWLREQQAVFYHAQLLPGMTVDSLRAMYPSEAASVIASFVRMGEMRELIRGLHYEDRELEAFVKTSQLKMTSFEYAYERPKIREVLGLEFDRDGRLRSRRLSAGQRRGLMYLLERFKAGTLNTRSPELRASSSEHDPFVGQLRLIVAGETGDASGAEQGHAQPGSPGEQADQPSGTVPPTPSGSAPGTTPGGGGSAAAGSGTATQPGNGAGQAAGAQAGSRAPNRGETRSRLDMEGFEYKDRQPGCGAGSRNCSGWMSGTLPMPPMTCCGRSWSAPSRTTSKLRDSRSRRARCSASVSSSSRSPTRATGA
jgi:hypothetical protein